MGLSAGDGVQAGAMITAALLLAGLALALRAGQPVAYRLEDGALVVERRRGATRLIGPVRPHEEGAALGLRIGTGGVYGHRGRIRLSSGGWARAQATNVRRSALVRVGPHPVVVSPADPARFVREVRDA
ncbi:MAG: hypothetical protein ACO3KD_06750 [Gaiellales bacterium]